MRIGIVGGIIGRLTCCKDVAAARGHQLELHTGVISGSASADNLRALVARSELVVIVTDVNSHNAVKTARREARLRNRGLRIVRRIGASQLATLKKKLDGLAKVDKGAGEGSVAGKGTGDRPSARDGGLLARTAGRWSLPCPAAWQRCGRSNGTDGAEVLRGAGTNR